MLIKISLYINIKKEKAKFYIDELEAAVIEDREVHEKKN